MNKNTLKLRDYLDIYGFITANQCKNLLFGANKQGLQEAQRKLRKMYEGKVVKRYRHYTTKEYVYYVGKNDNISDHKLILMDLFSYIMGRYEVLYSQLEPMWAISNKRNDGHIIFDKDGSTIGLLVEVDLFHQTSQRKLDALYNSDEVQEFYARLFGAKYYPSVLIMNRKGVTDKRSEEYDVICTDYKMHGFSDLLEGD